MKNNVSETHVMFPDHKANFGPVGDTLPLLDKYVGTSIGSEILMMKFFLQAYPLFVARTVARGMHLTEH